MNPFVEIACDIEVPVVLVPGWMDGVGPTTPFVILPMPLMLDDRLGFNLPITPHQRIYKWPSAVGPINTAGRCPQTSPTPKEIPQRDPGMSAVPMTVWPRGDDPVPTTFGYEPVILEVVPVQEQEGFEIRNIWTRGYKTASLLNPLVFGGFNTGSNARFVISGITRNDLGVALGGCTVYALRVLEMAMPYDPDAVVVDVEVSDANGVYSLQVRSNERHQVSGYKTGTPDVAGVTVNTLIPVET